MFKFREGRKKRTCFAIMGVLTVNPATATTIAQVLHLNVAKVSMALAALESKGLVTSAWADGPSPRPRIYRLVEKDV